MDWLKASIVACMWPSSHPALCYLIYYRSKPSWIGRKEWGRGRGSFLFGLVLRFLLVMRYLRLFLRSCTWHIYGWHNLFVGWEDPVVAANLGSGSVKARVMLGLAWGSKDQPMQVLNQSLSSLTYRADPLIFQRKLQTGKAVGSRAQEVRPILSEFWLAILFVVIWLIIEVHLPWS